MSEAPPICGSCGTRLVSTALSCPTCHQLVFAAELEDLANRVRTAEADGDRAAKLEALRRMLQFLPPESIQSGKVRDRITTIEAESFIAPGGEDPARAAWLKRLGPLGVVIAFLLKSKGLALLFLTKAKFLFLGLGKIKTLLSMLATMGVYWSLYGWRFALGFVFGIYIHEMGHVWALKRCGLRASSPMFIPGFGAFVSLYDSPADEAQDAYIGLAGPLWGAGAALAALIPQLLTSSLVWLAIARANAFVNLFNLTPIWQLDGGRAFRALDARQRQYILGLIAILWFVTGQGLFFIVLLGAAYRVFWKKDYAPQPNPTIFLEYAGLLVLFAVMLALIPMPK